MRPTEARVCPTALAGLWLGLLLVAAGCEPAVLDWGPAREADGATDAGTLDAAPAEAGTRDSHVDAASELPEAGADGTAQITDGAVMAARCVTIGRPDWEQVGWGDVVVHTVEELSCELTEVREPKATKILSLPGPEPFMRGGETHSLRWDGVIMVDMRVFGGERPCDALKLYEEVPDVASTLQTLVTDFSRLPGSGCRNVQPPVDVYHLRLTSAVTLGRVELCAQPCP